MSELKPDETMPWCPAHLIEAGETAIWWGRPEPRSYAFHGPGWGAVFVGGACATLSLMVCLAILAKESGPVALLSLAISGSFAVFGVWMAAVTVRERREEAGRVTYLLTDRRAVIARPSTTFSLEWPEVRSVELAYESGQRGSVFFYERIVADGDGTSRIREGFIAVTNAAAIAREMRRRQSAAAA